MSDIRWEGFTHEEIYARVQQGPGRAASADAEAAWATVESTIRAVDEQLTAAVRQIGAGWQGAAADGVHGGLTVMSNWALDAAGDALLTKNGIEAQAEEAGHVRAAMPPPRTAHWNDAVGQVLAGAGLVPGMADIGALEDQMANDRARAVELMNQYSTRSSENQQMMNYWTQPPAVVVETVAPAAMSGAANLSPAGVHTGQLVPAGAVPGAVESEAGAPVGGAVQGGNRTNAVVTGPDADLGSSPRPDTASAAPGASAGQGASGSATGAQTPGLVPVIPAGTNGAGRVPGAGTSSGAGSRLPRTELPTGVRPVLPGPPPQPSSQPLPHAVGRGVPSEPIPRPGVGAPPGSPSPAQPGTPTERGGAPTRGAPLTGHGVLPMGGVARPTDQEHRRPDYLIDDTDAFADDRWFTPPVIGGDDEVSRA